MYNINGEIEEITLTVYSNDIIVTHTFKTLSECHKVKEFIINGVINQIMTNPINLSSISYLEC